MCQTSQTDPFRAFASARVVEERLEAAGGIPDACGVGDERLEAKIAEDWLSEPKSSNRCRMKGLPSNIQGGKRMRESCTYGFVRGRSVMSVPTAIGYPSRGRNSN
jgi:hypothetical protein